ncbi:MAG: NlpC/P60 family protein [Candidatus Nanopelagicales bacterium]|nr:NlpC/P60 family protein [Candidatus Nanopelagicales bacterium]
MRTTFSRPQRLITGAVTGTLLITTMGFGSDAFAANGDPAPNAANAVNGVTTLKMSLRSGKLAPKSSPKMLARAREMILRSKIVKVARQQIGDRYVSGQDGPNAFDCSGLTSYVFKVAAGKDITRSSFTQYRASKRITRKSLRPGDLVFYFKRGAHHVGVYIGSGKMVHSPKPGQRVQAAAINGPWYGDHISGYGRIIPAA